VQYDNRENMDDENMKDDYWNNETAKYGNSLYEK